MKKFLFPILIILTLGVLFSFSAQEVWADTATIYSSASDGYLYKSSYTSYTAAHNASNADEVDSTSNIFDRIGQIGDSSQAYIRRGGLFFDTSGIPAGSTINSASLYLYGKSKQTDTSFNLVVIDGSVLHIPMIVSDYGALRNQTTSGGSISSSAFSVTGYNSITLNTNGRSWIHPGGWTKLGLRTSQDISGTPPPGGYCTVSFYASEQTGKQPKLVVDYTSAGPTAPTVTTDIATVGATEIQNNRAIFRGTVTNNGGAAITYIRFMWGTTSGNYPNSSGDIACSGCSTFQWTKTGMTAGTTYYYKAQASNSAGWSDLATTNERRVVIYQAAGGQKSFKTCQCSTTTVGGCCDGCHFCPAGTVYNGSSCVAPSTKVYCGTATSCTAGTCTGHKYYRACDGLGACRTNNTGAYDQTVNASAYKVLTTSCTDQDANSQSLACDSNTNYWCTEGNCSGYYRYSECNGGGTCDGAATTYYQQYNVVASTGYTLTSTCGATGTTLCGYSTWNACNGSCQKKRDQLRCDASHNCAYDVGDDLAYLSTSGKVCSVGSEVAPSSSINCDKTIDCVDNSCSAARYYRGCVASGTSCTETGKVSYAAWNAPANYTISETTYKVGDTCATNQDICAYSTYNKCGGTGSPYSCQKGRDQYRCNGAGSCTQDIGDEWANVASGYVCSGGSEVAAGCTYYCGSGGNYCTGDRYKGEFRQACGGGGSCNGSIIGCNGIQDCGATSNTCSSKCQQDYIYTCSAGVCGAYHAYTTAPQGYYCSGGNFLNTGSCAVSAYNGRSADKCDKKRDLYRCDGGGGADANCIFDVGDEWAYVPANKIANASGQEVDASSADNTGTCHSCTEGSCSGTLKWGECDGSGNPGPCPSYNQPETVYAQTGYTLTSTCSTNGTSYCTTNLCRDGGGWHHRCSKRCDAAHNCEYWIDASCVDHCTNGIKDCDETGTDCGGSCPSCDITPPTTGIKIIRTATGEDVTTAGTWLRADNYTIKFEDKDQADGSGSNCENCTCEYSVYACDAGGTNCTTAVTSLTSRNPNWSFQITAGKTAPAYNLEGVGRYRIYSGARDMANYSATEYRYVNFDFTPPWTEIR